MLVTLYQILFTVLTRTIHFGISYGVYSQLLWNKSPFSEITIELKWYLNFPSSATSQNWQLNLKNSSGHDNTLLKPKMPEIRGNNEILKPRAEQRQVVRSVAESEFSGRKAVVGKTERGKKAKEALSGRFRGCVHRKLTAHSCLMYGV